MGPSEFGLQNRPKIRYLWLLIGSLLAIAGQSVLRQAEEVALPNWFNKFCNSLDHIFSLSLDNPVNILTGLLLISCATIFFRLAFSLQEYKTETPELGSGTWGPIKPYAPWFIAAIVVYVITLILLSFHIHSKLSFWLWILSLAGITTILWKSDNNTSRNLNISFLDSIWILTLFGFAVVVGSYLLNDFPAGWLADEGAFWKMARSIALGIRNPSFFEIGVFTFPMSSSIFQAAIMRWAGIDMWGWRFSSVLAAAFSVIPLYLLTKELFDRRVAIASILLMVVNPYYLSFARFGYNNSHSLFPVALCIYFLVVASRKNSRFLFWLAGLAAGLGFYTYFSAWLGLFVLILVILILTSSKKLSYKTSLPYLGIILMGTLAALLPRVIYAASGDTPEALHFKIWESGPINTFYGDYVFGHERMSQSKIIKIGGAEVFLDPQLTAIIGIRGIIRTAAALFDPLGYKEHYVFFGMAGVGSSIFFMIGFVIVLSRIKQFQYLIPAIWFLSGFLLLGALTSLPPRPTHLVAIIPVLAMVSAIGVISTSDILFSKQAPPDRQGFPWGNAITNGSLAILVAVGAISYFILIPYFYSPPNEDDYISWLGRQVKDPVDFYLIDHYASTRNPVDETLVRLTPHRVKSFSIQSVEKQIEQIKTWTNFISFISAYNGRSYAEELSAQIPGSKVIPAYSTGHRLRGYIITDLEIDGSMDNAFSSGLADLWNSPARIFVILCGLGVTTLLINKGRLSIPTNTIQKQ